MEWPTTPRPTAKVNRGENARANIAFCVLSLGRRGNGDESGQSVQDADDLTCAGLDHNGLAVRNDIAVRDIGFIDAMQFDRVG